MTHLQTLSPLPHANRPATVAAFTAFVRDDNPARFRVGDSVTFDKMDPRVWPLLILGIQGKDVEAMCYDGNPHLVLIKMADLEALRVVRIEEAGCETVDMYRGLVGLPVGEYEE